MIIKEENYFEHIGTPRHSGRYPWGSGGDSAQRSKSFLDYIADMKRQGLTDAEIYTGLDMKSTEFRNLKSIARNETKQADIAMAVRLKAKGYDNGAIGKRMGNRNESSIRSLLADSKSDKINILQTTVDMLKEQVDTRGFIDVGTGVHHHLLGVSSTVLATAVAWLKDKGYAVENVLQDQAGTVHKTKYKVLAPPGTTYKDIVTNMDKINQIVAFSDDGGRNFYGLETPLSISSKRLAIRYAEDGGADFDGVIYVRPGINDVSLDGSRYAQVRIGVDDSHYIKGVAMYKDDLPVGVDLMFNTNKSNTGNKLDALKPMKTNLEGVVDPDNPFGSTIRRQIIKANDDGTKTVTSVMNIVNEQGDWDRWSRNLASQTLSKQSPTLAKTQLNMTYERKKNDLDEIMSLTNPTVRKKLLEIYADETDSSAVHLEAARLPRTSWHVLLPFGSMKENEIYAPNFRNGEVVALVRYPHGGTFEIPELVVNNTHPAAKQALGRTRVDAVGINSKVAERLSGADFDGDAVLVIPNKTGTIKTTPALTGLKDFDPQAAFPKYPGMKVMDDRTKGIEMGKVTNLITDMTIQKANTEDLAKAIRHSMVVIDAQNHELNYKESARANNISQLKLKYQGSTKSGASTLISKARAREDVLARKARPAKRGGPIDPVTGRKVFEPTGESYERPTTNKRTGVVTTKTIFKKQISKKLVETDDAHTLSSGTLMEKVYADHSNKLKALANTARKEAVNTKTIPYEPSAKAVYSNEVASLSAKLNIAEKNRPLERQAQIITAAGLAAKKQANPDMDADTEKKIKFQALEAARTRTGARRQEIKITDTEWDAIQAGAISNHKLTQILNKADLTRVKQLATPKTNLLMSSVKLQRAQAMVNSGYTQAEIADALGVSLTTLKKGLSDG